MKKLMLRRHSIKDGLNDTIGLKGLALAENQGALVEDEDLPIKIFHGPLVQTAQTALAFSRGLGHVPKIMPVVDGLGDGALLLKIANSSYKVGVNAGLSNLEALLHAHYDENQVEEWVNSGHRAIVSMLAQMEDGETGVGFFNSPCIELAAWACHAEHSGVKDWDKLKQMEGLIFTCDGGRIRVTGKISVAEDQAA